MSRFPAERIASTREGKVMCFLPRFVWGDWLSLEQEKTSVEHDMERALIGAADCQNVHHQSALPPQRRTHSVPLRRSEVQREAVTSERELKGGMDTIKALTHILAPVKKSERL